MNKAVPTGSEIPDTVPETFNMARLLLEPPEASDRSERTALYCGEESFSYGELIQFVNQAGRGLLELGLRREQRVLITLPDSPAFVAAFLGAMKIGAVPVPVTTLASPADYEYFLQDSRARLFIVSADLLRTIEPALKRIATLEATVVVGGQTGRHVSWDELVTRSASSLDYADTRGEEMSYWLYSSGTTGRPKAVVHLHGDMVHCTYPFQNEIVQLGADDRIFSVPKMGFSYGLVNSLYLPLLTTASVVLLPERPSPARIIEILRRYRPTVFFSVPSAYLRLLQFIEQENPNLDLSCLRRCISAGEPLPAGVFQQWRRFGLEILDGLGSTEVGYIYLCSRPNQARAGSCGQLLPGYEARLADEHGQPVGRGEVGELWLKAESTAAGYWHDEPRTRQTFWGKWFRTGDLLTQEADGYYRFWGRHDELFKVAGYWVSPLEVEERLLSHRAVAECAVVGVPDAHGLIRPRAYVRPQDGCEAPGLREELEEFLKAGLEPYKVPRKVEFVSNLPRTPTGKLQRARLRSSYEGDFPT